MFSARFKIRLATPSFEKVSLRCQVQFAAIANRRFEFQKRGQLLIRVHNETLSVSQDRARIVFDCRMANDRAMII
jgi:hypothetical protein